MGQENEKDRAKNLLEEIKIRKLILGKRLKTCRCPLCQTRGKLELMPGEVFGYQQAGPVLQEIKNPFYVILAKCSICENILSFPLRKS